MKVGNHNIRISVEVSGYQPVSKCFKYPLKVNQGHQRSQSSIDLIQFPINIP